MEGAEDFFDSQSGQAQDLMILVENYGIISFVAIVIAIVELTLHLSTSDNNEKMSENLA